MTEKDTKESQKKGFFARLLEALDEKLKKKAEEKTCCGGKDKDKGSCS